MPPGRPRQRASTRRSRADRPPPTDSHLTSAELDQLSAPMCGFFAREACDAGDLPSFRAVAVVPGQSLAHDAGASTGRDRGPAPEPPIPLSQVREGDQIECGPGVELDPDGELRARRYGYLCLQENQLSVLSPLRLSPDAMHLYWIIPACQAHSVSGDMILECARDLEVTDAIDPGRVEELCARLRTADLDPCVVEISTGVTPRSSAEAAFEILVDVERRAGVLREDGSLDFHQVNFAPTVATDQLVARRLPAAPPVLGRDLRGNPLAADDTAGDPPPRAGDNIRGQMNGDSEEFYATIDGLLRLSDDGVLSVANVLTIKGDVSFHTGNLTFDGDIFVDGSVSAGFAVDGSGSVTISGTVEPGSTVKSGADVAIGKGIVGILTRMAAGGDVRAQFVQEARVAASGDISLGSFAYHARLHAGGSVSVTNGSGQRRGSILGGETWARGGIDIRTAGTISGSDRPHQNLRCRSHGRPRSRWRAPARAQVRHPVPLLPHQR